MNPKLYLIPSPISENNLKLYLPLNIIRDIIPSIKHYFVENIRPARRFLKKIKPDIDINELHFFLIGKNVQIEDYVSYVSIIKKYNSGIITDAGCPGIADPGAKLVQLAHINNIPVVPHVGPSSVVLALMASGLNGQKFEFKGYLPIDKKKRLQKIKKMEFKIMNEDCTQIFIETPYRNEALFDDLIRYCREDTMLCVAVNLTSENEYIKTQPIKIWKQKKIILKKQDEAVFMLGR